MGISVQFRRGTAAEWTAADPILLAGEVGFETDTNKFKIGDGSSAWSALAYVGGDMLKATYDTDEDDIVDKAEAIDDGAGNTATAADLADAVTKKHTQGTDQKLDDGGANEVAVADAKDAVDKKHTQLCEAADFTKLDGIATDATKYPDTGEQAFLDADHTKLDGIAAEAVAAAGAVAAVEAAGLALADGKCIKIEETLATDHTHSGITCDGIAGEELVFGKLIYLDDTNHRWWKCQADDEDTHGAKRLLGMMVTNDTVAAAGAILVLLLGFITDTGFSLSDYGAPIFISAATAGAITETAPTGTPGFIVRIIGHTHDDANTFYFNPGATYVEIA